MDGARTCWHRRPGALDLDRLAVELTEDTAVVSTLWANNETGVCFPVNQIAQLCKQKKIPYHCDATQAIGKLPVNVAAQGLDVMSFALSLENLEAAFYTTALSKGALAADVKKLATELGSHEQEHVATLSNALQILGGNVPKPGAYKFPISDQPSFLKLAAKLEDTGVAAYNGAAPNIQSEDILSTLGSIVQVEARHAAAVRERGGQLPAPVAFDQPMTAAQVTAAVKPFGG